MKVGRVVRRPGRAGPPGRSGHEPAGHTRRAVRRLPVAPGRRRTRPSPRSTGPPTGGHQLPRHLDSSARAYFDFAVPGHRKEAYQLVLLEAADVTDHEQWLQRTQLLEPWSERYLPRAVRAAWQSAHLELARIGAGPHVPQP